MTGLQEAFYIIAIIFMGVMFILIIAQIYVAVVIRNRVVKIQQQIEDKINAVAKVAETTGKVAAIATGGVVGGARRALRKK
jgi:Na+-transporting methylmalonyl-CoA/oxaloacetate decarboxylase gamma subunit